MTVISPQRMYRMGATRLSQVPLGRGGHHGFAASENWEACSGVFNDPGTATGVVSDVLNDALHAPTLDTRAIRFVQQVWAANTADSTADLTKKLNAALNGAGYRATSGGIIT